MKMLEIMRTIFQENLGRALPIIILSICPKIPLIATVAKIKPAYADTLSNITLALADNFWLSVNKRANTITPQIIKIYSALPTSVILPKLHQQYLA